MELKDFRKFLMELMRRYNRKTPPDMKTVELWFQDVEQLPVESLAPIMRMITSEHDSIPANLPKLMKEAFSRWLGENPKKRARRYEAPTGACMYDGEGCIEGMLFLWSPLDPPAAAPRQANTIYAFRCTCGRWNCKGVETGDLRKLLDAGYELDTLETGTRRRALLLASLKESGQYKESWRKSLFSSIGEETDKIAAGLAR